MAFDYNCINFTSVPSHLEIAVALEFTILRCFQSFFNSPARVGLITHILYNKIILIELQLSSASLEILKVMF